MPLYLLTDTHASLSSSYKLKRHKPNWYDDLVDEARRERRCAERKWRKTTSDCHRFAFDEAKEGVSYTLITMMKFYRNSVANGNPKDVSHHQ